MVTAHSAGLHLLPAQFPRQLLPGVTVLSGQCSTTIIIILVILAVAVIITFAIIIVIICYAGSQSSVLYHISYHHRHTSNLRNNPES